MNTPRVFLFAAAFAGLALPLTDVAAQSREQTPEPPRLERLEEGEAPAVTIPARPSEQQIQETRKDGRVTSIRVTSGGSTYTVTPNEPKGSAQPGDLQSVGSRPAQWQVMEFHADRQKEAKDARDAKGGNPAAPASAAPTAPAANPAAPAPSAAPPGR